MRARVISSMARFLFPEVLSGFYTDLEIVDATDTDVEIVLNEDGDIILNKNNEQ